MRIYLDNCCYNRMFDEQIQQRVHDETEAINSIVNRSKSEGNIILGSNTIRMEIDNISDEDKRFRVLLNYNQAATEFIYADVDIFKTAEKIMRISSIKKMDALHLACAEIGNADIFLTTDDKLIKASKNCLSVCVF